MAKTYEPIATTTLSVDTASYTFTSIPNTYTDLILIINAGVTTQGPINAQINSDTTSTYSYTRLYGNGTSPTSDRFSSQPSLDLGYFSNDLNNNSITQFLNYSNTTTYKSIINRWSTAGFAASAVGLWRSTTAINSIKLFNASPYNLKAGSTFTLYGIKAA